MTNSDLVVVSLVVILFEVRLSITLGQRVSSDIVCVIVDRSTLTRPSYDDSSYDL